MIAHFMGDPLVLDQLIGRQGPFGHLAIAAIGQINFPRRRNAVKGLGQRGHLDPILVAHQGIEKADQPALLVNVFFCLRPDAEFLPVIAENGNGVGMLLGHFGQVFQRLLRRGEGNQVSQPLAAGKHRQQPAFILGNQVPGKLRIVESRGLEMKIVENRVFDAGVGQVAAERLLPHAFGDPHSTDCGAKAVLQPAGIAADLSDPVSPGDHRQNGLEKRPPDDLDLPAIDQLGQAVDICGLIAGEPLHQRPAYVQRHLQRFITAENLQKRIVAVFKGLLKNTVEVADGLMVVQRQDETDSWGHDMSINYGWFIKRKHFLNRQPRPGLSSLPGRNILRLIFLKLLAISPLGRQLNCRPIRFNR